MFLSFIVPVYNVEQYVGECLDSLLDQDIPREDYEIICINDGSTDESLAVLRQYADRHTNIRVIDKPNGGVASARNAGFDAARGEYIWYFDSDDLCVPNCLGAIRQQIEENRCDRLRIGTYVFGAELTEAEKNAIADRSLKPNSRFYDSIVCGSVLRRAFLLEHNCYFHYPSVTHGEDSLYMTECVQHLPVMHVYDAPVYLYRTRHGSAQHTVSTAVKERQLQSYLTITVIMKGYYDHGTKTPVQTANALMTYLWITLFKSLGAPAELRRKIRKDLNANGLFPFVRPKECTLWKSYHTTRTDFLGKLYDKMYINLHRPWGYAAMILYRAVWDLAHKTAK